MTYPTLNYPPIHLRARRTPSGRTEVFDSLRGRWLVLTPEEWVRRHVVQYMVTECNFTPQLLVEEYPVAINGMAQRADIVAVGSNSRPLIVVECKESGVKLDYSVLEQVIRYNSILGCKYVVMTNGLETRCYEQTKAGYTPMTHFPHYE